MRMDGFTGRLATTSAVVTEAMYFVSPTSAGPETLAEFVDASGMEVYDLCQPPELRAAAALMRRYADTPMDFADATLVLLAEAPSVNEIRWCCTTRRRHPRSRGCWDGPAPPPMRQGRRA